MRRAAWLLLLSACSVPPALAPPAWKLTPLHVGICRLGEDHVLGDGHSPDRRLPFVIYSFLAEGPAGEVVLIDLGPKTLAASNAMFRRFGFFRDIPGRPDDIVQPHGNVFDHLRRRGIAPERVTRIVFTHFHADHHGLDDAKNGGAAEGFPNARFSVSKKGWAWNLGRRVGGRWNSYLDHAFGDFLLEAERRGHVDLLDDGPIAPGLEVAYLGGHSICSRAVRVRTVAGWAVIASDEVYRYDLLERGILARLHVTPEALAAATDRLVEMAQSEGAVLLPLHEPKIAEAYVEAGDAWLERLRPLSARAVEGYRARMPACRLRPLHTGICTLGEDHVFGEGRSADDRVPFVLYSFLIEGPGGEVALADLGAKSVAWINRTFRRVGFFRNRDPNPDEYVQPHGNALAHLARLGLSPDRVAHVVYTHLHYDHNGVDAPPSPGLCADFPNAVHHLSKKGWEANLATRRDGVSWSGYVDFDFSQFMLRAGERGRARFEDDAVVLRAPGGRPLVWTVYLGGHSVCSQAVVVRTAWGPAVIASDEVYHYEFLEKGIMARLHVTPEKLVEATDRLVELVEKEKGILLPLHDPLLWKAWEEKGERWLEALKPVSDRAVRGYRERRAALKVLLPERR